MTRLPSPRLSVLPLVVALLAGCGPNAEEINNIVQARLEADDLVLTGAEKEQEKRAEEAKTAPQKSMDFLASLDKLMADYKPTLPEVKDDTNVLACLTDAAMAQDPGLVVASKVLYADVRAAERARSSAEDRFERQKWLQYRLDYGWQTRVATTQRLGKCVSDYSGSSSSSSRSNCTYREHWVSGAMLDSFGNDDYDSIGQALYSHTTTPAKPELMARLEAAGGVVPDRFSCLVEAAEVGAKAEGWPLIIGCKGSPAAFISVSGDSPTVNIGDEVSVPLKDAAADPSGVLAKVGRGQSWRIAANKADLRVDTPATCPSDEEIALKAIEKGKVGAKPPAALVGLIRGSPPVTEAGKLIVAWDDVRQKNFAAAGAAFEALGNADGMAVVAQAMASANDVAGATALLNKVVATKKDPKLLLLLGGLEIQAGDVPAGQGHLRDAVATSTDAATAKSALALLQSTGDAAGAASAKQKACDLGDKRSCK